MTPFRFEFEANTQRIQADADDSYFSFMVSRAYAGQLDETGNFEEIVLRSRPLYEKEVNG